MLAFHGYRMAFLPTHHLHQCMINMILEVASALPVDREDGGIGVGNFQFHLFFTVGFFRDILGVLNGAFFPIL